MSARRPPRHQEPTRQSTLLQQVRAPGSARCDGQCHRSAQQRTAHPRGRPTSGTGRKRVHLPISRTENHPHSRAPADSRMGSTRRLLPGRRETQGTSCPEPTLPRGAADQSASWKARVMRREPGRQRGLRQRGLGGWLEGRAGTEGTGPVPTLSPKGRRLLRKEDIPGGDADTPGDQRNGRTGKGPCPGEGANSSVKIIF